MLSRREVFIRILALLQRTTLIETKNRTLKCLKRHYSTVRWMKNVATLTEDGAFALFLRTHPGAFDSSRVPTPGNLPSKEKKNANAGGQPGGGGGLGAAGIDWCINNKILNSTRCSTANQWTSINTGDKWSSFLDNVTSLAAEFNTYCRRWILYLGRPYESALQLSNLEVTKASTKVLAVSIMRNFLILQINLIEWVKSRFTYLLDLFIKTKIGVKNSPMFLAWLMSLRLALATCRQSREGAGRCLED